MSEEEGQGFVIRDRRGQPAEAEVPPAKPGASREGEDQAAAQPAPPISFSSFVFSMGTSALMLMGERIDPSQLETPVNLSQAKEIIDILSVLEEKTRGNLTSEEQAVLEDMLYALRMKYVDLSSGKKATPSS